MQFTVGKTKTIKASININNRIRLELSLTMEEYAIAQVIYEKRKAGLPVNKDVIYYETGIREDEGKYIIKQLEAKGVIERKSENGITRSYTTEIWNKYFNIEKEFDSEDDENPGFWQIFLKRGNKQQALKTYIKARKVIDEETLKKAAHRYIASKDGEEFKHIMHASTWLNPDDKHWEDVIQIGKLETKEEGVFSGEFYKTRKA